MKFVLFVEGHTEKEALGQFIKRWLDTRLAKPVRIKVVRLDGWRNYEKEIGKKVNLNLSGVGGADVIAAIGLLDLYGPTFYPNGTSTATERYAWAKQRFEKMVGHPKFRQHFAVHETEAWLLADPTILPDQVATALPGNCREPETVNFVDPPSKLLSRLYRSRLNVGYKKVTDGANLFQALDPGTAGSKCPHLQQLLNDMLALAKN